MMDAADSYVNSEIVCTLAALGYEEDKKYYKGDDCIGEPFADSYFSNNFFVCVSLNREIEILILECNTK